jgi:tetratricopeptide (TPR) repeat protein
MNPQIIFLLNKSLEFLKNSNLESAELYLKQVLKLQFNNPHALSLLGVISAQQEKYNEALNYLNDSLKVSPNPTQNGVVKINFNMPYETTIDYFITSLDGKIITDGEVSDAKQGENSMNFEIDGVTNQTVIITFIFNDKFYVSQKVIVN